MKGMLFNIQSYCVNDGPGLRTLIFIKGCPLSCHWCSNPEGISPRIQLHHIDNLCLPDCQRCIATCPEGALRKKDGRLDINWEICNRCSNLICTEKCFTGAMKKEGFQSTTEEIFERISREIPFYGNDGGITISGGEPFTQSGFICELLKKCKTIDINTAVESCLAVPFENIKPCLEYIDLFMFDLKIIDRVKHREYCGKDNSIVLENVAKLAKTFSGNLLPRMPVIKGINDDNENIDGIIKLLLENKISKINLLPYMKLGIPKYSQLGMKYKLENAYTPDEKRLKEIQLMFRKQGINCSI